MNASRPGGIDQLVLDFPHQPVYNRDDFVVTPANSDVFAKIDSWPEWTARALLIIGPERAGKTHLAHIFAERASGLFLNADTLDVTELPAVISSHAVIIDDVDRSRFDEKTLFHILNLVREQDAWLVMTARSGPEEWDLGLPDLRSRLRAVDRAEFRPPDDELLRAVIVKLLSDRQMTAEGAILDYLLMRIERSLAYVYRLVDAIDQETMLTGRKLTRPLAAKLIAHLSGDADVEISDTNSK